MACKKCSLIVEGKTDLFVVCEGKCYGTFHASCVGLSEASVCCLSKNIVWLCDDCLFDFHDSQREVKCSQSETTDHALRCVTAELTDISTKIANVMKMISEDSHVDTSKEGTNELPPIHSTPNRSLQLHAGSRNNISDTSAKTSQAHSSGTSTCYRGGTFSLFLTNIDEQVTENEIADLVSQSLEVDATGLIGVRKLGPKWTSNSIVDYASFKVLLDVRYKETALQPHIWPSGIMYREFFERPRKTWKPDR